MNIQLQLFLIIVIVIFLCAMVILLKNRKLSLRYTLLWLMSGFVLLIVAIFPGIISWLTKLIGIVSPVNAVFVLEAIFVLMIMLSLTVIVSQINRKLKRLIQDNAVLEERVRELEEKMNSKV